MSSTPKPEVSSSDELMKQVGALKEAREELKEELENANEVSAEEVGSTIGQFLKGLLSVFRL